MDSDVRLSRNGAIEFMLENIDDKICAIGMDKRQKIGYPHIANYIAMFRVDLAKKYKAFFMPNYPLGLETGTMFTKILTDNGYKIKYCDLRKFHIHLRYTKERQNEWNRYF